MTEILEVRPYRKTITQTAIILNISKRSVRRKADAGDIEWSDGQITIASIQKYLSKSNGKRKKEEASEEVEEKIQHAIPKPQSRPAGGWMRGYR